MAPVYKIAVIQFEPKVCYTAQPRLNAQMVYASGNVTVALAFMTDVHILLLAYCCRGELCQGGKSSTLCSCQRM
jgi:hypothetical protein